MANDELQLLQAVEPLPAPAPTEKPVIHLYFLLDRSGSMSSIQNYVVAGFNDFVTSQKFDKDTEFIITLIKFDSNDSQEILYEAQPIDAVKRMVLADFAPRGGTPLIDATVQAINHAQKRKADHPEENIVFISMTDGQENGSHKYKIQDVNDLTSELRYEDWQFVYVGANVNAQQESRNLGYPVSNGANYKANSAGVSGVFEGLSRSMTRYRDAKKQGLVVDTFLTSDVNQVIN